MREGATAGQAVPVRAVITIPELGMTHEVTGTITAPDAEQD